MIYSLCFLSLETCAADFLKQMHRFTRTTPARQCHMPKGVFMKLSLSIMSVLLNVIQLVINIMPFG